MDEFAEPFLRHGLVGLCGLHLVTGAWLLRSLLQMAREVTRVVDANTAAVRALVERGDAWEARAHDVRDRLIARPCLAAARRA